MYSIKKKIFGHIRKVTKTAIVYLLKIKTNFDVWLKNYDYLTLIENFI